MPRKIENPTPAQLAARERRNAEAKRERSSKAARAGDVPAHAAGKVSRLHRMREDGGRTWDEIKDLPSLRHVGDLNGLVMRADLATVWSTTMAFPMSDVLTALELVAESTRGSVIFLRAYVVDPPTSWVDV